MSTEQLDADLDTVEGCKLARQCARELSAVVGRYKISGDEDSGFPAQDMFEAIKASLNERFSEDRNEVDYIDHAEIGD